MATPEELKAQIDTLEAELAAAQETAAKASAGIDALEAEEVAAEEVAVQAAPVIASKPSISQRVLPRSQFYQGQDGCDK
jgi:hypothetical protein